MTKKQFIEELLKLNPNMRKVGTSDVWMGEPHAVPIEGKGLKLVNMAVTLPHGATLEGDYICAYGFKIRMWRG